jgi:hypothetical protein
MQEQERIELRQLIGKAADGDGSARAAIEDMIMALDKAGRAEDVSAALEQVATFGPSDLHQAIVTRLQVNDHSNRQQWPTIG